MKKLINDPGSVVPEMVEGLTLAFPGLRRLEGHSVLVRADEAGDRVAIISGGGSGHEPAHAGYVGRGMLAAAVAGDVFTSPTPDSILAAIRAVAGPAGVLLIVKNYTGDRLNFGLAAELARADGIPVETVIVADDVALAASVDHAGRRGLAGTVLVHKVSGAASEAGAPLAEVAAEAAASADAVRTMGVALAPCTIPAAGRPGFDLGPDEIELGLGIHGEPGVRRAPLEPADRLVDHLLGPILADLDPQAGEPVALLVNNLGATPPMELAIVARRAVGVLEGRGLVVGRVYAGTFLSALEMTGVSLTVMRLDPMRLERLDAPTDAPAWPNAANRPRSGPTSVPGPAPARPEVGSPRPPRTEGGRALEVALLRVADALLDAEPHLTELDRAAGDGDLGISLARGARAIRDALPKLPADDPGATLRGLGLAVQRAVGGTSGPLYATGLLRAASVLGEGSPGAEHDPSRTWAAALRAAAAAVAELGGARAGDRTMLDALLPASTALDGALEAGRSAVDALEEAADAAEEGARASAAMVPRLGRASYLGDRAVGHIDPGAAAVATWLRALAGRGGGAGDGPRFDRTPG